MDAGYSGIHGVELEDRRGKAKKAEAKQMDVPYHQPIPSLSFPANRHIECAADCVKITMNDVYGRHVVATRDIPVGSVIAIEEPFTKTLSPANFLTHCFNCLHPSYNLAKP